MKKIITHKFCLQHSQNGLVLLFTMLLLLIIATLTIAFFYLQFLEVDLIAHETEYLQAFYLAEAGVEHGEKELIKNKEKILKKLLKKLEEKKERELTCEELDSYANKNPLLNIQNIQGNFCYGYKFDCTEYSDTNNCVKGIVTLTGKGWANEESESTSEIMNEWRENRREIEKRFEWQAFGTQNPNDWHNPSFGKTAKILGDAIVTSSLEPNLQERLTFVKVDINGIEEEVSKDQERILTFSEMTEEQKKHYINKFAPECKNKIKNAQRMDKNNNELLFPEERRHLYESTPAGEDLNLKMICGPDCPFEVYTEERKIQGERISIDSSIAILKKSRQITLDPGLYFFNELILKESSTINTRGAVSIYVKKLELEKNAKLMGGPSTDYHDAIPNDLIVLAECWSGSCSKIYDGIKIGSTAKVCGHIFAPNLLVRLSRGSGGKETRVHGSILTYQLITYIEPGKQASYGPIQIIYQEYKNEEINPILGSWREVRTLDGIL